MTPGAPLGSWCSLRCGVRWLVAGLLLMLGGLSPLAAQPPKAGGEFQVNSYTTGDQKYPRVATDGSGNFVVVWSSYGSAGSDIIEDACLTFNACGSIQARLFDATGSPKGPDFQVNAYTTGLQLFPDASMGEGGDFVVVWQSIDFAAYPVTGYSIRGQRFDSAGARLGDELDIGGGSGANAKPVVAKQPGGGFVVAWSGNQLLGRRFDSSGQALGSEFVVSVGNLQRYQEIDADSSGNFVIAWNSLGSDGPPASGHSIEARRFDSAATPLGAQFQVNTLTSVGRWSYATVGMGAGGDFVVSWHSPESAGSDLDFSIQARRYASDGTPIGLEFQVNTYTTGNQLTPAVSVHDDGSFMIVWWGPGIQGQLFESTGAPLGFQFEVDSYGYYLGNPTLSWNGLDSAIVAWWASHHQGTDASGRHIQAQRYSARIFASGFEDGDTSGWSSASP